MQRRSWREYSVIRLGMVSMRNASNARMDEKDSLRYRRSLNQYVKNGTCHAEWGATREITFDEAIGHE